MLKENRKQAYANSAGDARQYVALGNHNFVSCRRDVFPVRNNNSDPSFALSNATTIHRLLMASYVRFILAVQPLLNFIHLMIPIRAQHEPRPEECAVHQGEGESEPEAVHSQVVREGEV